MLFLDLLLSFKTQLTRYSLDRTLDNTRVEIGQLGENAVILGAAAVFANNYSYLFTRLIKPDRSN